MSKKYAFPDNEISYDIYLKIVEEMIQHGSVLCYGQDLEKVTNTLIGINDMETRKILIDSSVLVDRMLTRSHDTKNIITHKLPSILALVDILGNHKSYVEGFNIEELAVLGYFSGCIKYEDMEEHLCLFGNKLLIESVLEKTDDIKERYSILEMIEDKYLEFAFDKGKDEVHKLQLESIMVIRSSTKDELLNMVKTDEQRTESLKSQGIYI